MLREQGRLTLRVTITMTVLAVTVATAVPLLALTDAAVRSSLTKFTTVLLDPVADLVGEKTRGFLRVVEEAALRSP